MSRSSFLTAFCKTDLLFFSVDQPHMRTQMDSPGSSGRRIHIGTQVKKLDHQANITLFHSNLGNIVSASERTA
jgi:hypothetical protein